MYRTPAKADLLKQIEALSGQQTMSCYQCGSCAAGCPVGQEMEPNPRQALLWLRMGMVEELLDSAGIWLCTSCMVCGARCPRNIDYARITEACRAIVLRGKQSKLDPDNIVPDELEDVPQQAFIAGYRKFAG